MRKSRHLFALALSLHLILAPALSFAQQATSEERTQLESQLADLEKQIQQNEATIADYQKQGKSLKNEIGSLNAKISKLNLQIRAVTLNLQKLDGEITLTKGDITAAEQKLDTNKGALTQLLRQTYENDRQGLVSVVLRHPSLADFANTLSSLSAIQDTLSARVSEIAGLRAQLVDKKEALSEKRSDAAALKAAQDAQKAAADRVKKDKAGLLSDTQGKESVYQAILKATRKTAAQIRSRIFELLGGGELSFDQAYKFAQYAEQATGVRAAFTLAILDHESALGQNVGRCNYKGAMNPSRDIPVFLAMTSALAINPDAVSVSCANRDGAYGGAMGPAQFIPSTWKLYTDRVAQLTGHAPPSPWNNGDAFTATALYLKDAMSGCTAVYSRQADIERCGAAKYYSGARWRTYLWGYGDRVSTKAQQFQNDIDVLNS